MDQPPDISLSQEELTYLLHLLKVPALTGISPRPTNGMNAYHFHALMNAAERSLRARHWLTISAGGESVIDSDLLDLLRVCVSPAYTILVSRHTLDATPHEAVYYLSGRTRIKQYVDTGVHHFVTLDDDMHVFDDLFGLVTGDEDVCDGTRGSTNYYIPATLMVAISRIRSTAGLDQKTLCNQLINQGLSEPSADHLAHLVRHEMVANTTITAQKRRSYRKTKTPACTTAPIFNLMQTPAAWWLASPIEATRPQQMALPHNYTLTALDTTELYIRLNGLLMPNGNKTNGNAQRHNRYA